MALPTVETENGAFENRFDGHAVLEGTCFGASPGRVVVTVPPSEADEDGQRGFQMVHENLPSEAWSNERIELNLYHNPALNDRLDAGEPDDERRPFNFHLFDTPIKIEVFQNGNTTGTADAETFFPFPDIPDDYWAGRYIVRLWKRGVMDGQGDLAHLGQYGPTLDVTRAEFVKIMMLAKRSVAGAQSRVSGPLETSNCDLATEVFDDVADHWSCDYVGLLVQAGHESNPPWTPDYEGTRHFRPDLPLTRAGAARYAALLSTRESGEPKSFSDLDRVARSGSCLDNVAQPFADCVDVASAKGIVGGLAGTTNFEPGWTLNRAEAAKIAAESFNILSPFQVRLDGRPGCGLCGKGKVVILIHGLNSDPETWSWSGGTNDSSMVAALQELGYAESAHHTMERLRSASAFEESPGSLFSIQFSSSTDLTLAQQAQELGFFINAVVEIVNPAEIVLVGHSMGGLAARALAELPLSKRAAIVGSFHWKSGVYRSAVSRLITLNTPHEGSPWPAILGSFPWDDILDPGPFSNNCLLDPTGDVPCTPLCFAKAWLQAKIAGANHWKATFLLAEERLLEPSSELSRLRSDADRWSTLSRWSPIYVATREVLTPETVHDAIKEIAYWKSVLESITVTDLCWEYRIFPALQARWECTNHDFFVCQDSQWDTGAMDRHLLSSQLVLGQWHGSTRNAQVIGIVKRSVGPQGD
jgi:pimeloyl-ACP methyl ester carboxylesterase